MRTLQSACYISVVVEISLLFILCIIEAQIFQNMLGNILFQIHDSQGCTWQFMYFVSMVVLGAFFVMNLILGVLSGFVLIHSKSSLPLMHILKQVQ